MIKRFTLFFIVSILLSSCGNIDCEEISKFYRTKECLIIVKNIPNKYSGAYFEILGKNMKTSKDTIYKEENRWFCSYYDSIDIGDTLVKRKGELIFNIHKKDTILSFNYECDGKTYK